MAKKISKDTNLGDRGIALIDLRVGEMGLVWHHRPRDAGIDGQIESRDAVTGEVFNRFILVQSKASDRPFPGESPDSDTFYYLCRKSDLDYWMNADEPVIVVCSHPTTYEAWWAHVQSCFSDPQQRTTRHLLFNKRTDAFDRSAATRLLDLADAAKSGYMAGANRRTETLESNLLLVTSMPSHIFVAQSSAKDAAEMFASYREADMREQFGWILRGNSLYSFDDLSTSVPKSVVTSDVTMVVTESWARSTDPETRRNLVALLNRTLHQDHASVLAWNDRRRYLYFKANPDRSQIKIPSGANNSRTVVMPKPGKLPGAGYFWHAALKYRFMMIDGLWYLALIPTYHFTRDGAHEAANRADLLHGIKLLEKNKAVLSFTRTWARYLRGDDRAEDGLFPVEARLLTFGDLATFDVDQGIDDSAWAAAGSADSVDTGQLDLFDDFAFEDIDDQ